MKMKTPSAIAAVAIDVDGVLTDNSFWWGSNGEEFKRFCFADLSGLRIALSAGVEIALVSGESSPSGIALVERLAKKVGVTNVYAGCHDKSAAVREFAKKNGVKLSEICFMGDDLIDIPAMSIVGLAAAPPDAHPAALAKAGLVTK